MVILVLFLSNVSCMFSSPIESPNRYQGYYYPYEISDCPSCQTNRQQHGSVESGQSRNGLGSIAEKALPVIVEAVTARILSPKPKPVPVIQQAPPQQSPKPSRTASLLNAWSHNKIEKSRANYAKYDAKRTRVLQEERMRVEQQRAIALRANQVAWDAQLRQRALQLQHREMQVNLAAQQKAKVDLETRESGLAQATEIRNRGMDKRETNLASLANSVAISNSQASIGLASTSATSNGTQRPVVINLLQQPGVTKRIIRIENADQGQSLLVPACQYGNKEEVIPLYIMDSTLWTIFIVLVIVLGWLVTFVNRLNKHVKGSKPTVKESLFGKKKRKGKKEKWSFAD